MRQESVWWISVNVVIIVILVYISVKDVGVRKIGKAETCILTCLALIRCDGAAEALVGGLVCAAVPEIVNLIFFQLRGLGGGDIRLLFAAGCLLGLEGGFLAFLAGGVLALLTAAGHYLRSGSRNPAEFAMMEVPFGAFLSAGMILMLLVDMLP